MSPAYRFNPLADFIREVFGGRFPARELALDIDICGLPGGVVAVNGERDDRTAIIDLRDSGITPSVHVALDWHTEIIEFNFDRSPLPQSRYSSFARSDEVTRGSKAKHLSRFWVSSLCTPSATSDTSFHLSLRRSCGPGPCPRGPAHR